MDIEEYFTPAEAKAMRLRAQAFAHLSYATDMQIRDPSGSRDRHLARIIQLCQLHGLTEAEIRATIRQVREEEAA